ncbi:DNA alkylation repair protein [Methanosphaera sp.]|jgi:3-methyladenine DNA glycosylase AlkD|uniref:DNA alkylation repair protein n=1 Tax=Methanosphaera sp. TaxID=2666342 RepID=UPI002A52C92B|nr:DNA alkylation repair protein [Methanobacteriaceae archaeon]MDY2744742.1 DNA alkylation repair protein [Methanosphaera sp.]
MQLDEVLEILEKEGNPDDVKGMARFGINPDKAYGIRVPVLRKIAKTIGKDHELAIELWNYGYHDTKLLATMIDDPTKVTSEQINKWAYSFETWDQCDQACSNLFRKTRYAYPKIHEFYDKEEEFVKRTAYSLIATLAVHDKKACDDVFINLFPIIISGSSDERNFVKKAVNWSLRQIGKRNKILNQKSILLAEEILKLDTISGNWIAHDALRELKSEKVQKKFKDK